MLRHLLRATFLAAVLAATGAATDAHARSAAPGYCVETNRNGSGASVCTPW